MTAHLSAVNTSKVNQSLKNAKPLHRKNNVMVKMIALGILSAFFVFLCHPLAGELGSTGNGKVQESTFELLWLSSNKNRIELTREIERLLLSLYNTGHLPIKKIKDEKGRVASEIALDEGIVKGPFFPVSIDSVLCDVNPHICSREFIKASPDQLKDPTMHVGGFLPTRGNWTNMRGDEIYLIDMSYEETIKLIYRVVPRNDSIGRILKREKANCSALGDDCFEITKFLNPSIEDLWEPSDGKLKAIIPTPSLKASVPIEINEENIKQLKKYQSVKKEKSERQRYMLLKDYPVSEEWQQEVDSEKRMKILTNTLEKNLLKKPSQKVDFHSFIDNSHGDTKKLLNLIGHPMCDEECDLEELKNLIVRIGVIDTWVDSNHCQLQNDVKNFENTSSKQINRGPCISEEQSTEPIDNHGTHIVGLITAEAHPKSCIGIHPKAKVIFSEIDVDKLGENDYNTELSMTMFRMAHLSDSKVRIFNLSWDYPEVGDEDPLLRIIRSLKDRSLIVASSGNEGKLKKKGQRGCTRIPACLTDTPNVISVIGLNRDESIPEVWTVSNTDHGSETDKGSNYGTAFHIAAIAQNVLSTTNGNKIGRLSGTSMATPQVATAAGLLLAYYRHTRPAEEELRPVQIKNRLMYSADIFPNLLDDVYSGRLNIKRAVSINDAIVVFKNDDKEYKGIISKHPPYVECRNNDGENLQIAWKKIKRIVHDGGTNSVVVYYEENFPDNSYERQKELKRKTNCVLETRTNILQIEDKETNQIFEGQLRNVVDYTARL
jgi:hypothetical protein